uniref:Uncharacterized protein n=1 Tax=Gasterosteus aculeatus TaxID=69293 RepID=G3PNH7_GASAC
MIICFLCQRPMMLPYTSRSLNRKNLLGCGPLRVIFTSRPSPSRNRPGSYSGFPDGPNEFSTARIRSRLFCVNKNHFPSVSICVQVTSQHEPFVSALLLLLLLLLRMKSRC